MHLCLQVCKLQTHFIGKSKSFVLRPVCREGSHARVQNVAGLLSQFEGVPRG